MDGADGERKWAFALLLACPACVGGLFLGVGVLVGLTAALVKGLALVGMLAIVGGLWARNAWLRRHEDAACPLPGPGRSP